MIWRSLELDIRNVNIAVGESEGERYISPVHALKLKRYLKDREGFFTPKEIAEELFPNTNRATINTKIGLESLEERGWLCFGRDTEDGQSTFCTHTYWKQHVAQ